MIFLATLAAGCSGTIGKLRENSEKAAHDRDNAWNGDKKKLTKEEKARAKEQKRKLKEAEKAKGQADAEWEAKQRATSEQIRAEDREYLNQQQQDGEPKSEEPKTEPAVDVVTTQDFPTFLRMVRNAVRSRDAETLAPLMTPNFGYNLDPLMEGPGVFEFWEKEMLWSDLELLVAQNFVPSNGFMVAPPEFIHTPGYAGYRAGMVKTRGGWRFAYFVKGQVRGE